MTVWSETFLAPIMAQMAEQETTIRGQAETIGRQSAELERAASSIVALNAENQALRAAQPSSEPSAPLRRLWILWWPILTVLVALVAAGVLLGWPW
jgi:hypothetical protein